MTPQLETIGYTVGTYLFLRYIWEARLSAIFDRWFKPYKKSELHSSLLDLRTYLSTDWLEVHVLPNRLVYAPLCREIKVRLPKYVNSRSFTLFVTVVEEFESKFGYIERATNMELLACDRYLRKELLPLLDSLLTQI